MEKAYVIVRLVKDNPNENWRFLENDVPGSLVIYTTFRHAAICVSTLAEGLRLKGWREHVFYQVENVREWHEFCFKGRRIALLIIEEMLLV